jgi:hypothetical protein
MAARQRVTASATALAAAVDVPARRPVAVSWPPTRRIERMKPRERLSFGLIRKEAMFTAKGE